jgi:hypothetical protein
LVDVPSQDADPLEGGAQMTHSSRNTLKTALLLGLLSALILLAGQALGGGNGLLLAGLLTLLINGGAYFFSTSWRCERCAPSRSPPRTRPRCTASSPN